MEKNLLAAELTGDDLPSASKNLKLFLTLDADAESEAF
jgi:hypothetical protein